MPVSREEYDRGHIDLTVPIADYLDLRREDAFTAAELLEQIIQYGRAATIMEVIQALRVLVAHGRVDTKELAGIPRYIIRVTRD